MCYGFRLCKFKSTVQGVRTLSQQIDETLSLPIILAWLRVHWAKILFGGIVFAVLSIPVTFIKDKTYESAATLLVSPPTFKDRLEAVPSEVSEDGMAFDIAELMPRTLPVEAYKAIALSAPLLDEVIGKVPLKTGIASLQRRLNVELIKMDGPRTPSGTYTQALMFSAVANDPALAAKTAQAWAEVFKERVDEMARAGIGETFALLETLHSNTKEELERADQALAEHQKAWNLELIEARLKAKQLQFTEFESDLKKTEVDLASGEMKLKTLEEELAKESAKIVLFRAPSDDVYWITRGQEGGESTIAPDQGLRTEKPNANYVTIREAEVESREELSGLKATRETIIAKLGELEEEMATLTQEFSDQTVECDRLTRELDSLVASYGMVRLEYEKGRMAELTQASDIVIAGDAVPVNQPRGWGAGKLLVVAAALGMFLTGGVLLLKRLSEMVPMLDSDAGGLGAFMIGASGSAQDSERPNDQES